MSSLFIIWSVSSFVLDVPSGAWADLVDRRRLLLLSAVLLVAAFTAWTVAPGYPGFAAGFVLWGASSALMSGTFEALLYDELVEAGDVSGYGRLVAWTESAHLVATLAGAAAGGVLLALGGARLVGWVSVAMAVVHVLAVLRLPGASKVAPAGEETVPGRYGAVLREGLREATASVPVRRLLVLVAVTYGMTASDEYLPLVAIEHGTPAQLVPVLVATVLAGELVGTVLAGRSSGLQPRTIGLMVAAAGVLLAAGALVGGWAGFVALAAAFGLIDHAVVVSEARLQHAITGRARATVTSVSGLSVEVVAVGVFAGVAIGSSWLAMTTTVALLGLPLLTVGAVARWRWSSTTTADRTG